MSFEQSGRRTLHETRAMLPAAVQELVPGQNAKMYEAMNDMHCNLDAVGGSKFTEIQNIFEVLERDGNRIAEAVRQRKDDREALLKSGADPRAFLPATKRPDDPATLPEALYYKVDGIKGRLGLVQLNKFSPDTRVLVRREKSHIVDGEEKLPASYTVIRGTLEDMPEKDFATVIVGREGGGAGENAVWTIHPGAPIRPAVRDTIPGTETLKGPQEGQRQKVMVVTVRQLLESGMVPEDYVKMVPGDFDKTISQYDVIAVAP